MRPNKTLHKSIKWAVLFILVVILSITKMIGNRVNWFSLSRANSLICHMCKDVLI